MRTYVEHALRSRPVTPRPEDRWEKVKRIGREACEKIPVLVDTNKKKWSELLRVTNDLEQEAATQLLEALALSGIRAVIKDKVLLAIHHGLSFLGRLVASPVVAVLNFFDETPRFSNYLKKQ